MTITQIKNNERKWYLIDLKDKAYGRELTRAAGLLMGKGKTNYTQNLDQGDYVVIINADKALFTGRKLEQKTYYKHTGYLGNMKSFGLKEMLEKKPIDLVRYSVGGMLPKNKLRDDRLARLKIYTDDTHPHLNVKFEE